MKKAKKTSAPSAKSLINLDLYPALRNLTESEITELLWRKGSLSWKLNSAQKELTDFFHNSKERIVVVAMTRQIGKTFTAVSLALEYALQNPNTEIKYCCGNAKTALKATRSNLLKIIEDCPKELKPTYDRTLGCYKFKNGSLLHLEGLDSGKADDLRGTAAKLIVIDEAGFINDLTYALYSVLFPMTNTTKGKFLIISTPPRSAGHDFDKVVQTARGAGAFYELNAYKYLALVKDDPSFFKDRYTLDAVEENKKNMPENAFNREILCQFIRDEETVVIPEFTEERKYKIVKDWVRPKQYDAYVSMDLGMTDLTAILFAYYDFVNNKLVIEDELEVNSKKLNSDYLGSEIVKIEARLWTDDLGFQTEPLKRVCDINEQIARVDLNRRYNLQFVSAKKDDKDAGINMLRVKIQNEEIIINPRCKKLIFHLENATWNKKRTSFERTPTAGHYDFVDAMLYLIRAVKYNKNPFGTPSVDTTNMSRNFRAESDNKNIQALEKMFSHRFTPKKPFKFGAK